MKQQQTYKSIANLPAIRKAVKDFDPLLEIDFSPQGGYYYVSREFRRYDDREAADICSESDTCFAEALKRKRLVVCYPIPVKMVEEIDIAIRNILRHLKGNDIQQLAATSKERVRIAEQKMNDEFYGTKKALEDSGRDDMRAYSREYFRDHVRTRAYFGGVPRLA